MSEKGFVMLNRGDGIDLLENDHQAFLLLSHIALRARRTDLSLSRVPLKPNQAFIGDHEKIGLTRQQYRDAQTRLSKYNLVLFEPTNKGTIATLISTAIYDINAEREQEEPTDSSMKTKFEEPTKNHTKTSKKLQENQEETIKSPPENHHSTNHEPLTNKETMKECKNATPTTNQPAAEGLYLCLQAFHGTKGFQLTDDDKMSLMHYPRDRITKAIEYASHPFVVIKRDIISTLHWHCKQLHPPLPPEGSTSVGSSHTPQQALAQKYNEFLKEKGHFEKAKENSRAIQEGHCHILLQCGWTTVSLNSNPVNVLIKDFEDSKSLLLKL